MQVWREMRSLLDGGEIEEQRSEMLKVASFCVVICLSWAFVSCDILVFEISR